MGKTEGNKQSIGKLRCVHPKCGVAGGRLLGNMVDGSGAWSAGIRWFKTCGKAFCKACAAFKYEDSPAVINDNKESVATAGMAWCKANDLGPPVKAEAKPAAKAAKAAKAPVNPPSDLDEDEDEDDLEVIDEDEEDIEVIDEDEDEDEAPAKAPPAKAPPANDPIGAAIDAAADAIGAAIATRMSARIAARIGHDVGTAVAVAIADAARAVGAA